MPNLVLKEIRFADNKETFLSFSKFLKFNRSGYLFSLSNSIWRVGIMNIILNSYCNLKCNYCFADEYMEETVKTPGKSMDFDFFTADVLPRVKTASLINFMGG